jgi:hypothetical protein|tara:strand:- start:125 stop:856 length:732 start_codon:yes stop_codon:yes gene_type:complete
MQFSDTSNLDGIVQDITFLLGNIGTTEYVLNDRARNVNERYRQVWEVIFNAYGGWEFVDNNISDATTLPWGEVNLVSGTAVYALPSAALTINGVEVKDSGGNWSVLTPLTYEEIREVQAVDEFNSSNGVPMYYVVTGDVIELFPAPDYSQATSLRVYFSQDISTFSGTGDDTKVPGFASPFHRALSVGAALDFAMANGMNDKATMLQGLFNDYLFKIRQFYGQRFRDKFPPKIKVIDSFIEYQ